MASAAIRTLALLLFLCGVPQAVFAGVAADCIDTDPSDYASLRDCMASAREDGGNGWNIFLKRSDRCWGLRGKYRQALQGSGLKDPPLAREDSPLLPSCEMIALVLTEFNDEGPYWAGCMGYDKDNEAGHFKRCVSHLLPRYTSGKTFERIENCEQAINYYQIGLSDARFNKRLPPGYTRPECETIAEVIGEITGKIPKWTNCLDFDADHLGEHVAKCLGRNTRRLKTCNDVRNTYENGLREAYGGRLPKDYGILPCSVAEPILAGIRERKEKAKAMRLPENACPYEPPSSPITLYEAGSKGVMSAPTRCGPYFVYIDLCMVQKFRGALGMFTLSTTPPDEATDTIVEAWTYRNRVAASGKVLSRGRKIGIDRVRYVPFSGHIGTYYDDMLCQPYKPDVSVPADLLMNLIKLPIKMPKIPKR